VTRAVVEATDALRAIGVNGGPARRVFINGKSVHVAFREIAGDVSGVLDKVVEDCHDPDARVALGVHDGLGERGGERVQLAASRIDLGDGVGASLCSFRPRDPTAHDLSPTRYTLARATTSGRLAVTDLAFEEEAALTELFPAHGDAPGSDPAGARPPDARRMMTAFIEGEKYAVRLYASLRSPTAERESYESALATAGWERVAKSADGGEVFARQGEELVVSFDDANDGSSVVAIASR
jgi:hypothetical protein